MFAGSTADILGQPDMHQAAQKSAGGEDNGLCPIDRSCFDFYAGDQVVFSVEKKFGFRDRYVVDIKDPRLDRRLVIAQAIGLDALQSR